MLASQAAIVKTYSFMPGAADTHFSASRCVLSSN